MWKGKGVSESESVGYRRSWVSLLLGDAVKGDLSSFVRSRELLLLQVRTGEGRGDCTNPQEFLMVLSSDRAWKIVAACLPQHQQELPRRVGNVVIYKLHNLTRAVLFSVLPDKPIDPVKPGKSTQVIRAHCTRNGHATWSRAGRPSSDSNGGLSTLHFPSSDRMDVDANSNGRSRSTHGRPHHCSSSFLPPSDRS